MSHLPTMCSVACSAAETGEGNKEKKRRQGSSWSKDNREGSRKRGAGGEGGGGRRVGGLVGMARN